jgi:phosphatidylethanolamine N-methyltransferase
MIFNNLINFSENNLWIAIAYIFLNLLSWLIIPHMEFKYKILSRLLKGQNDRAADFVAYFMIYIGTIRNYYMDEAIKNNIIFDLGAINYPCYLLGGILFALGSVLVVASFYRLGLRGLYFGDHFGFFFKEKVTAFPYDRFESPQYVGTCMIHVGIGFIYRSPTAFLLAVLYMLKYSILNVFEGRKLKIFYPDNKETRSSEVKSQ